MMRPYAALGPYAVIRLLLVCLILGPFAPWLAYLGKLRRRGHGGWLVFSLAFIFVYALLWFAPLRWEMIVALYLLLGAVSFAAFKVPPTAEGEGGGDALSLSAVSLSNPSKGEVHISWRESFAVGALVVYPILFGYGLLRDIDNLREFSIHLPAAVYVEALIFTLGFGTPGVMLLGFLLRRAGLRPNVRLVLFLYGGVLIAIGWISLWERLYQYGLFVAGVREAGPLLFEVYREISFRTAVHGMFYAGGILLGAGFLATSTRLRIFIRRAFLVGALTGLGYANCVLLLGESGYFLAGLRDRLHSTGHFTAYRFVGELEAARLPNALHIPALLSDLGDLALLQGRGEEAEEWRGRVLKATKGKPFFAPLRERAVWEDSQIVLHPGCVTADSMRLLAAPRARPGVTLDGNWLGLLSAVSFFRPEWSDFDLKKKLLEISPDIQLSVPNLGGLPVVAEVLDVFGVPFSACFLDSLRLHAAREKGLIPFVNFEGGWMPVVGWDPCRRGFLCYRYPNVPEKNPWFKSAEGESVFGSGGPSTGSTSSPQASSGTGQMGGKSKILPYQSVPYELITFIPERDLLRQLHDIGGVALVLGDSTFASSAERRAAYLTEYGDVLYQQQDDMTGASAAYARAQTLYPSDYILARQVYLERRRVWSEGPDYGLDAIFRSDIRNQPFAGLPNRDESERMADRILRGGMGQYLLLNGMETSPRFFPGKDSSQRHQAAEESRAVFRTWLRLQPHNPLALDSLAAGFQAQARWDSAEVYYRRVLEYRPLGDEYAAFRLAWVLFKRDRFDESEHWLRRCRSFQLEARYLLMQAAVDWNEGRRRPAIKAAQKSLKLDKTLPETHALLERMAVAEGDSATAVLHRLWRERTSP